FEPPSLAPTTINPLRKRGRNRTTIARSVREVARCPRRATPPMRQPRHIPLARLVRRPRLLKRAPLVRPPLARFGQRLIHGALWQPVGAAGRADQRGHAAS